MALATISPSLERAIRRSCVLARERGQPQAGTSHLLAALLDDPDARDVLEACAVDHGALHDALARSLGQGAAQAAADPQPDEDYRRVVQKAVTHVQASGRTSVSGANLLAALVADGRSPAAARLTAQGPSRLDLANYMAHGIRKARP